MKYSIIYADPPWDYRDKANSGKRGASHKYKTLKIEDIKTLPIQNIACKNCVLCLWVTGPLMDECVDVLKGWGFKYKGVLFTWIKENKIANTDFWGMGSYSRSNPEFVLLGMKGRIKRQSASVHSVVRAKIGKHSEKPLEIATRIRKLFGPLIGVELFATKRSPYFETTGFDVDGVDIRDFLNKEYDG